MAQLPLIIVTYRDAFQWAAQHRPASEDDYQVRSAVLRLSPADLKSLGVSDGVPLRLSNASGEVVVQAKADAGCPRRFGFMPVSRCVNLLTTYDGTKSELPDFKRIEVLAQPAAEADLQ